MHNLKINCGGQPGAEVVGEAQVGESGAEVGQGEAEVGEGEAEVGEGGAYPIVFVHELAQFRNLVFVEFEEPQVEQ